MTELTDEKLLQIAADALGSKEAIKRGEGEGSSIDDCLYLYGFEVLATMRAAIAADRAGRPQPTPVAPPAAGEAIGPEWRPCVKLPIAVHVREQRPGETHVTTRNGITPIRFDDMIMRGPQGEEYPIGRELFNTTYRLGPAPAARPQTTPDALQRAYVAWFQAEQGIPPSPVAARNAAAFAAAVLAGEVEL